MTRPSAPALLLLLTSLIAPYLQGDSSLFWKPEDLIEQTNQAFQQIATYQDRGAYRILHITDPLTNAGLEAGVYESALFTTAYREPGNYRYEIHQRRDQNTHAKFLLWADGNEVRTRALELDKSIVRWPPQRVEQMLASVLSHRNARLNPVLDRLHEARKTLLPASTDKRFAVVEGDDRIGSSPVFVLTYSSLLPAPTLETWWIRKRDFAPLKRMFESEKPGEGYTQIVTLYQPELNPRVQLMELEYSGESSRYFQFATDYLDFGPKRPSSVFLSLRERQPEPPPVAQREPEPAPAKEEEEPAAPETTESIAQATQAPAPEQVSSERPANYFPPEIRSRLITLVSRGQGNAIGFFTMLRDRVMIICPFEKFVGKNLPTVLNHKEVSVSLNQLFVSEMGDYALINTTDPLSPLPLVENPDQVLVNGFPVLVPILDKDGNFGGRPATVLEVTPEEIVLQERLPKNAFGAPVLAIVDDEVKVAGIVLARNQLTQPLQPGASIHPGEGFPEGVNYRRSLYVQRLDKPAQTDAVLWGPWQTEISAIQAFREENEFLLSFIEDRGVDKMVGRDPYRKLILDFSSEYQRLRSNRSSLEAESSFFVRNVIDAARKSAEFLPRATDSESFKNAPNHKFNVPALLREREFLEAELSKLIDQSDLVVARLGFNK